MTLWDLRDTWGTQELASILSFLPRENTARKLSSMNWEERYDCNSSRPTCLDLEPSKRHTSRWREAFPGRTNWGGMMCDYVQWAGHWTE